VATCLHVRFRLLPARDVETGGRQVVSFLPVKGRGDVMPLQVMELRLFVKGQVMGEEGVVTLVSSPSPSSLPQRPQHAPPGGEKTKDFRAR
jgi:hypothetical protein